MKHAGRTTPNLDDVKLAIEIFEAKSKVNRMSQKVLLLI